MMPRRVLRVMVGPAVLVVIILVVGPEPIIEAVTSASPARVALAMIIGAATTAAVAARWVLCCRALRLPLRLGQAYPACYQAQLLNALLPAGVLGDAARAVGHGRRAGIGPAARAVFWERASGQLTLLAVTGVVVLVWPRLIGPDRPTEVRAACLMIMVALAAAGFWVRREGAAAAACSAGGWRGRVGVLLADVRTTLISRTGLAMAGLSLIALAGYLATFLVAASAIPAAGGRTGQLIALGLITLVAMAVPFNVGGFGPREAGAALAFAAAGLGAGTGVAVAALYGLLSLAAALPGAIPLVINLLRGRAADRGPSGSASRAGTPGSPGAETSGSEPARRS